MRWTAMRPPTRSPKSPCGSMRTQPPLANARPEAGVGEAWMEEVAAAISIGPFPDRRSTMTGRSIPICPLGPFRTTDDSSMLDIVQPFSLVSGHAKYAAELVVFLVSCRPRATHDG